MVRIIIAVLVLSLVVLLACTTEVPTPAPTPTSAPTATAIPTPTPTPLSPHEQSRQELLATFSENYATWQSKDPQNYSFSLKLSIQGITTNTNHIQVRDGVVYEANNYGAGLEIWRKLDGRYDYSTSLHRDYMTESGEWRGDVYDPFEDFDTNAKLYWNFLTLGMDYNFSYVHDLISNWQPDSILSIRYDSECGYPYFVSIAPVDGSSIARETLILDFIVNDLAEQNEE